MDDKKNEENLDYENKKDDDLELEQEFQEQNKPNFIVWFFIKFGEGIVWIFEWFVSLFR